MVTGWEEYDLARRAADDLSADQQMDHVERSDAAGMTGCDRVCGG